MTLFTDSVFLTNEVEGFRVCREERSATSMTIILCLAGHIEVELEGHMVRIAENDLFVRIPTPGFQPGPFEYSPDYAFMQLTVDAAIYEQLVLDHIRVEPHWWQKTQFLKGNPVFHLSERSIDICKTYFHLMEMQLSDMNSDYRQQILMTIAKAATMDIFDYLDKILSPEELESRTSVDRSDYTFRQFTQLLHENPSEREVQWFAQKLDITPKYLSEICRLRSGKSASEWIAEVTVSHIKHYLRHTTMPIREIADTMDFPNASFFCQYTKKHTGLTPNQLRRQKTED